MSYLHVVVGGQAGSEAKGHVAAQLAARDQWPTCIRVAGPNAGHTVVNPRTGTRHALRQIPVGAVTNENALACIAAGSEVDLDVLADEIDRLENDGIRVRNRLIVDLAATVLTEEHKKAEADAGLSGRIGSTGKGIGAARAARIMRIAQTIRDIWNEHPVFRSGAAVAADVAEVALRRQRSIHIEGTQGYMLGLHTEFYPQVTSSDCTALDFLAMARINPWVFAPEQLRIWVVFRPYPIRVAGNSGPLRHETTWADLGLPEERTTVTNKVRRVGRWDGFQARQAVAANGAATKNWVSSSHTRGRPDPIRVVLSMADQLDPDLAGVTTVRPLLDSSAYQRFIAGFSTDTGRMPSMVTTSDRTAVWIPSANGQGDHDLFD